MAFRTRKQNLHCVLIADIIAFKKPFDIRIKLFGIGIHLALWRGMLKPFHGGILLDLYIAGDNAGCWWGILFPRRSDEKGRVARHKKLRSKFLREQLMKYGINIPKGWSDNG